MGALDEGHYCVVLENGVKLLDGGFEHEPETVAIEDAVKVLLQGLGEDVNREGLRKTPLRVAKALREGTRGENKTVSSWMGPKLKYFGTVYLGCYAFIWVVL
ncbi:putative GTP cyclohydrolase I [Helianthus annuus]|nr:putative GTP cyclohydrolase I [Helianthus annuus]